ncbi:MAG: ABC transporter ATP-binding protein [Oscillospiraceae bacterium]|nr:ABC transporter ATP-binding protein [Oscillospiraceae bacterium]
MEKALFIKDITKNFGEKTVLDNISLEIKKGEIFGLLGPSGAGKTTLIKILTGQLKPENGMASINGTDSQKLTGKDYSGFGIMMDNFGVYERLSCFENLKTFARIYGVSDERIYDTLKAVGLSESAKKSASELSKGMKSRLRLARVFMTDPDILFLDEPTSGLDPAAADEIQKMILAEKAKGKTIFLTTHTMTEAEKLCDNIALLNEGKIVEYGNPKEICRRCNHQKKLKIHLADGTDREIPHNENAAEIISELLKSGKAETIHTTEPDLETVFMELTGKELSA